jgi:hypothetical protein
MPARGENHPFQPNPTQYVWKIKKQVESMLGYKNRILIDLIAGMMLVASPEYRHDH